MTGTLDSFFPVPSSKLASSCRFPKVNQVHDEPIVRVTREGTAEEGEIACLTIGSMLVNLNAIRAGGFGHRSSVRLDVGNP